MRIRISRSVLTKIAFWSILLLLAPFVLELILIADIAGVEATLAFLFLYTRWLTAMVRERVTIGRFALIAAIQAPPDHELYGPKVYVFNTAVSMVAFWISGSALLAILMWLPSIAVMSHNA